MKASTPRSSQLRANESHVDGAIKLSVVPTTGGYRVTVNNRGIGHSFPTGVTVVSAFHNVAAHELATDEDIDCDVLVFGDDKSARAKVVALANQAGLRGLHGGALANSAAAEALTSILIFINKTYSVDGAGIKITGNLKEPKA